MAVTSPTAPAPRSRSIYQQVVADAWQRWGVRVGVAWIGLLLLLAVFSPFIASSHPLLMKVEGAWESPLVRHLGKVDVLLLVAFCVAVPLIWGTNNVAAMAAVDRKPKAWAKSLNWYSRWSFPSR